MDAPEDILDQLRTLDDKPRRQPDRITVMSAGGAAPTVSALSLNS